VLYDFSVVLCASFHWICYSRQSLLLLSNRMDNFYMELTLEALNLLKKKELTKAATHYGLNVPENASKATIKKLVLDYLVEEELIAKQIELSSDTMRGQQLLELKHFEFKRERKTQLKNVKN